MSTYGRWQVYNWNSKDERENTHVDAWVRVMLSCHCQKNNWSVIDSSRIGRQTQKRPRTTMIIETWMNQILLSNASEKIKHASNDCYCCCFVCLHWNDLHVDVLVYTSALRRNVYEYSKIYLWHSVNVFVHWQRSKWKSSSTSDACCSRCSFLDSGENRLDEQTPPRWSLERSIWLTWMSKWAAKWWRMIVVIADSSLSSKDLTLNMETCVARQSESTAFPPPTDVILTAMRERIER